MVEFDATEEEITKAQNRNNQKGWVYIAKFSGGVVKVGISKTDIDSRIYNIKRQASKDFNVSLESVWVSEIHHSFRENEYLLIDYIKDFAINNHREWCKGIDFDDLMKYARSLHFDLILEGEKLKQEILMIRSLSVKSFNLKIGVKYMDMLDKILEKEKIDNSFKRNRYRFVENIIEDVYKREVEK